MQSLRVIIPRFGTNVPLAATRPLSAASFARLFRAELRNSKTLQMRCYAQQQGAKTSRIEQELQRQARQALKGGKKHGMTFFGQLIPFELSMAN